MKKLKLLLKIGLVLILAVVLVTISISGSSFSWFVRPNATSGNSLSFQVPYSNDDGMVAYDGSNVTMQTYVSEDDGATFSTTAAAPATSGTLGTTPYDFEHPELGSNRIYYKTTLTNTGSSAQNVSLYIKNFSTGNTGIVCVGVNVPVKSFKDYTTYGVPKPKPSKTLVSGGTDKRIYFETYSDAAEYWNSSTGGFRVYYGSNSVSSSSPYKTLVKCPDRTYMYYADLPSSANQLYFTANNTNGTTNYLRTQTIFNLSGIGLSPTQSLLFKNAKWVDQTYNNLHVDFEKTSGAYIKVYYSVASLVVGDSIDLSLTSAQYGGSGIEYSVVSGGSHVSLDTTTGVLTANSAGTATIRYKVTSQHSDFITKDCTVTVKSLNSGSRVIQNAPIVTNLLIPGKTNNPDDHSNVQDVYWFIQNGDDMYGVATENASYTLDGIYLGL